MRANAAVLNLTVNFAAKGDADYTCVAKFGEDQDAHGVSRMAMDPRDLELFQNEVLLSRRTRFRDMASVPRTQRLWTIGTQLFDAAFPPGPIRALYEDAHRSVREYNSAIRVRLQFQADSPLASLPWEFAYDPGRALPLALIRNFSIVRCPILPESAQPITVSGRLRVLVAVSRGPDNNLDVDGEYNAISKARGIEFDRVDAETLEDIIVRLQRTDYHVFHYIGHASFHPESRQCILAIRHGSGYLNANDLGIKLHQHPTIRLAMLNACEGAATKASAGAAQTLILNRVLAAVAMQFPISDEAAKAFSVGFYSKLAESGLLDEAVRIGRESIHTKMNGFEWGTPTLFTRSTNPKLFDPVPPSPDPPWIWIAVACIAIIVAAALFVVYRVHGKVAQLPSTQVALPAQKRLAAPSAEVGIWKQDGSIALDAVVTELAYDPKGDVLAAVNQKDGVIRQYRGSTPQEFLAIDGCCSHIVFAPDSKQIVASTATYTYLLPHDCLDCQMGRGAISALAFPTAGFVLSLSPDTALRIDLTSPRGLHAIGMPSGYQPIAVRRDGSKILARLGSVPHILNFGDQAIIPGPALEDPGEITAAVFGAQWIIGGTRLGRVAVWDSTSGKTKRQYIMDDTTVNSLAVGDSWIVASWSSGRTRVWQSEVSDGGSGEPHVRQLLQESSSVTAVALDQASHHLAIASGTNIFLFRR